MAVPPASWLPESHHEPPHHPQPPAPQEKKKRRKWPWIVGGVVLLMGVAGVTSEDDKADTSAQAPTTTTTTTAAAQPAPVVDDEPVIEEAAAEGAPAAPATLEPPRGVKVYEDGLDGSVVFAEFDIRDSLTKGMRKAAAQGDTVDILKYVREAYPNAERYWVHGRFPTTGGSDTIVLNVGYDRATLAGLKLDGTETPRIWDLRDAGMVHRDLQ